MSCEGHLNEKKEVRTKCTGLCRVILSDGSTTVVPTSQTESIKDVVTRLLDKRGLRYTSYDVLILATDEVCVSFYLHNANLKSIEMTNTNRQIPHYICMHWSQYC